MKKTELTKILKKHGCYKVREGGKHEVWKGPNGVSQALTRNAREVATGTVHRILKEFGIK